MAWIHMTVTKRAEATKKAVRTRMLKRFRAWLYAAGAGPMPYCEPWLAKCWMTPGLFEGRAAKFVRANRRKILLALRREERARKEA